jgi:2-dehydro-3-deoxyphosphogluconate aldolase / (4S)-4-hydroxy-2-oxoglutarate aldolase
VTPEELRQERVAQAIRQHRLIAVMRRVEPRERLLALADDLFDSGVRAFEVTFDGQAAAGDLSALRDHFGADVLVGAGTVLTTGQLFAAHNAGADFAVAPVIDTALLKIAVDHALPFIAGGLSPTELHAAWLAGATFVKLFPASVAGPSLIRELHGPLPDIEIIPTGGVDASNARAFLDAGAVAVGIGSALTKAEAADRRALVQSVLAA